LFEFLVVVTVAWGVLAFGAVYPWAYWPLVAVASVAGVSGLRSRRAWSNTHLTAFALALFLLVLAIGITLIPLPQRVIELLSPASARLLGRYDLAYAAAGAPHPLSVDPDRTRLGLLCFLALAVFCIGCARRLTTRRATMVARAVTVLAAVVGVIGLVQKASGTQLIYGFWRPIQHPYQIFGPFVNKNHYAGWMIMALSLTLGATASAAAVGAREMRPGWHNRVLWLASGDANFILLALISTPIMVAALLTTLSRSGIVSFGLAISIASISLGLRVRRNRIAAMLTAAYAVAAVVIISEWSRFDAVAQRFVVGSGVSLGSRIRTWSDACRIARDHPVFGTGLNTFDTAMLFYQSQPGAHWDAAHNDYVQLVADGGLLLTIPIAIAVFVFVRTVAMRLISDRSNPPAFWLRLGAVLGLAAIAVQETVDFSLQLPGNAVMCALLVAIALHKSAQEPVDQRLTSSIRDVL
jgi:O-antigen ligase